MADDFNILDTPEPSQPFQTVQQNQTVLVEDAELSNTDFIRKFGRNPDVDTGTTPEDVWDFGGLYPFPAAALATTIVSGSVNDAAAGTGMRTARVFGLDSSYNEIQEDVTLNGTTPVALVNSYLRVHRVFGLTFGSTGSNEGDVDVLHGATVLARITTGFGQTLMAIFTTPVTWNDVDVISSFVTIGRQAAAFAEAVLFTRDFGSDGWRARLVVDVHSQGFSFLSDGKIDRVTISPRTDVRWTINSVSANNTAISAGFVLSG